MRNHSIEKAKTAVILGLAVYDLIRLPKLLEEPP